MELSDTRLTEVIASGRTAILFKGGRLRIQSFSQRAQEIVRRLEIGAPVRVLFPGREARLPIAAIEAACDTGREVRLREPMFTSIEWTCASPRPHVVDLVVEPVLSDGGVVYGALLTASRAPLIDEIVSVGEHPTLPPAMAQGAVASLTAHAYGLPPGDAVSLLDVRQAAREAFVAASRPLIEELRRRGSSLDERVRTSSTLVGSMMLLGWLA